MALRAEVETIRRDVQVLRSRIFETEKTIKENSSKSDVTALVRDLDILREEIINCAAILLVLGHPVD